MFAPARISCVCRDAAHIQNSWFTCSVRRYQRIMLQLTSKRGGSGTELFWHAGIKMTGWTLPLEEKLTTYAVFSLFMWNYNAETVCPWGESWDLVQRCSWLFSIPSSWVVARISRECHFQMLSRNCSWRQKPNNVSVFLIVLTATAGCSSPQACSKHFHNGCRRLLSAANSTSADFSALFPLSTAWSRAYCGKQWKAFVASTGTQEEIESRRAARVTLNKSMFLKSTGGLVVALQMG